jgi:hypothetical protein
VQHPMVRATEAELEEHFIRVPDEIAIREKQKLNDVPDGLSRCGARWRPVRYAGPTRMGLTRHNYVSHVDIFCFYVTKTLLQTK